MGMRVFTSRSTKFVSATAVALGLSSCALLKPNVIEPAAEAPPPPPPAATVPGYAGVPHPNGLQIGDALALFAEPGAPKLGSDEMKGCAGDFRALSEKTKARDEIKQGLLELVRKEPIRYHWCFYGKILELEGELKKATMLDDRQRAVVDAFRFLAPLARAFFREFHDSRYLRWAVAYYRHASELAFYRRVESSPGLTRELIGAGGDNPDRGVSEKATSVLEKYGIVVPERLQPGQSPETVEKGELLPSDAYVDTGSGAVDAVATDAAPTTEAGSAPRGRSPAGDSVDPGAPVGGPTNPVISSPEDSVFDSMEPGNTGH